MIRGPVNWLVRRIRPRIPWCNSRGIDRLCIRVYHTACVRSCIFVWNGPTCCGHFSFGRKCFAGKLRAPGAPARPIHADPPRAIFLPLLNRVDFAFSRSFVSFRFEYPALPSRLTSWWRATVLYALYKNKKEKNRKTKTGHGGRHFFGERTGVDTLSCSKLSTWCWLSWTNVGFVCWSV